MLRKHISQLLHGFLLHPTHLGNVQHHLLSIQLLQSLMFMTLPQDMHINILELGIHLVMRFEPGLQLQHSNQAFGLSVRHCRTIARHHVYEDVNAHTGCRSPFCQGTCKANTLPPRQSRGHQDMPKLRAEDRRGRGQIPARCGIGVGRKV